MLVFFISMQVLVISTIEYNTTSPLEEGPGFIFW
jgi:hypothetical protein